MAARGSSRNDNTKRRRDARKKARKLLRFERDQLLERRVQLVTCGTDNTGNTTWEQRLANVEQVVTTVCLSVALVVKEETGQTVDKCTDYRPWHHVPEVDWGPFQSAGVWQNGCDSVFGAVPAEALALHAVPGETLAKQCRSARLIQAWWRIVRGKLVAPPARTDAIIHCDEPLAFLSLIDIGRLYAVSRAHTVAVTELGLKLTTSELEGIDSGTEED